jgi:hypothetical protein
MPLRLIGLRTQDLQSEFRFGLSKSVVLRNTSYGHLLKSYTFSQKFEAWEQYTFKFYPIEPAYQKKMTQPNFGTCGVSVHFFRKRRQNKHPSFFFFLNTRYATEFTALDIRVPKRAQSCFWQVSRIPLPSSYRFPCDVRNLPSVNIIY